MALPPDLRPPAPLPPDLPPLTAWDDPQEAAAEAVRRFTTPPPITRRITDPVARMAMPAFMPPDAVHTDVHGSEGRVAFWSWGSPEWPLVICMHGWGGRATQWAHLAPALLTQRVRVVALDGPAHGASDGDRASMPGFRNAILRVIEATGTPHALVGHSLGGLAVLATIAVLAEQGVSPLPRAVSIGAPNNVDRPLGRFIRRHEASTVVRDAMIWMIESRWDFSWPALDTAALAARVSERGGAALLVVHADDDAQVPVIESEGLTADWPGAERWLAPDGCGHLRILRDAMVIDRITAFVAGDQRR
jgi:pimeloyl-ACP methyl ester carboxylesterase